LRPVHAHGAGPALHPGRALYRLLRPDGPRLRPLPLRGGVPLGRSDLLVAPGRPLSPAFQQNKKVFKKTLAKDSLMRYTNHDVRGEPPAEMSCGCIAVG